MCQDNAFRIAMGINVYFAHLTSLWESGTNENTNGLIRQYFLKGTLFDEITKQSVKLVHNRFNSGLRRVLNYQTLKEAFKAIVAFDP